jgi:hypothetical protein
MADPHVRAEGCKPGMVAQNVSKKARILSEQSQVNKGIL